VSVYNLSHNFLRLSSTDMFSTQCIEYKTCSCACSHTKKTGVCSLFELRSHFYA